MSGSEVAGLVRYDDASLDGLRSLSAMAESEDYASAGRASGGEKLAGWEIKAPRKCAMVFRQRNSQNLLLCWAAPEFGLRRRGHSPLLMAFGRGGKRQWSWALPPVTPGPVPPIGAGSPLLHRESAMTAFAKSWRRE